MIRAFAAVLIFATGMASSAFAQDRPYDAMGQVGPDRGVTKAAVERDFGTPVSKRAAIGDPPISRWVYDGFTVYFEYDRVIHAVSNR